MIARAGVLALACTLAACAGPPEAPPLDPEFERVLGRGGSLFEGILAVDGLVSPKTDRSRPRGAYERLLRKAEEAVSARCGNRQARRASAGQAARVVLGLLRDEGYRALDLTPERYASALDPSLVSYTLLERKGTCCSLTMLALALLEELGVEGYGVCMPDHTFIRVRGPEGEVNLETTTFGEEAPPYDAAYLERVRSAPGTHYLRSHDRRQALWHYFADTLWRWAFRKGKDKAVLPMVARARSVLQGTCRSIDYLEAKVNLFVGKEPEAFRVLDDEALGRAEAGFRRVFEWDATEEDAAVGLALVYKCRGDYPSLLQVLKRFVESNELDLEGGSVVLYTLWYLTRAERDVPGFELTKEDAEEALVFFEFWTPKERWTEDELRALERLKRIAGR